MKTVTLALTPKQFRMLIDVAEYQVTASPDWKEWKAILANLRARPRRAASLSVSATEEKTK